MKNTSRFRTAMAVVLPLCAAVLLSAGGLEAKPKPRVDPRPKVVTCPSAVMLPSPDRVVVGRVMQPLRQTKWTVGPRSIAVSKATVEERDGKTELICTYGDGVPNPIVLKRTGSFPDCRAVQPDKFRCKMIAPAQR